MSDAYYQARAARRTRILILAGAVVLLLAAAGLVLRMLFYDACTQSFDRSPRAVVATYVEAVRQGNGPVAQECWEHLAYYDLEAGCSEICLSRAMGVPYERVDITLGEAYTTPQGRSNLPVTVTIACDGGQTHSGEIVLDSVGAALPWRHWAIVHSTVGGTVAQQWCK
jgi:hypothetical protein